MFVLFFCANNFVKIAYPYIIIHIRCVGVCYAYVSNWTFKGTTSKEETYFIEQ